MGCSERDVSLVFLSDEKIREFNNLYRGKDQPTDVLSFPVDISDLAPDEPYELGDILISAQSAARQAKEAGLRFEDELERLLIHGVLHLLGHDHHDPKESRRMKAAEKRLRDLLHTPAPRS